MNTPLTDSEKQAAQDALANGPAITFQEAADELERELGVRTRVYPDWIKAGRLSKTEARDRFDRLTSAHVALKALAEHADKVAALRESAL